MENQQIVAVIPARYASARLPGKALVPLAGKPMIQHVWERVRQAKRVARVIVATDDERILHIVESFGGEAQMTRPDHRSGTERAAEVAAHVEGDIFVNVQGDEPMIDPAVVDAAVETLLDERSEEHTSELQSRLHLVCRLLLEKKKQHNQSVSLAILELHSRPQPTAG